MSDVTTNVEPNITPGNEPGTLVIDGVTWATGQIGLAANSIVVTLFEDEPGKWYWFRFGDPDGYPVGDTAGRNPITDPVEPVKQMQLVPLDAVIMSPNPIPPAEPTAEPTTGESHV